MTTQIYDDDAMGMRIEGIAAQLDSNIKNIQTLQEAIDYAERNNLPTIPQREIIVHQPITEAHHSLTSLRHLTASHYEEALALQAYYHDQQLLEPTALTDALSAYQSLISPNETPASNITATINKISASSSQSVQHSTPLL